MNVVKMIKVDDVTVFVTDDQRRLKVRELSKETGVSTTRIYKVINNGGNVDDVNEMLDDQLFLKKIGVHATAKVYKRIELDGTVTRITAVCLERKGINKHTAYNRLAEWQEGKIGYRDLVKPMMSVERRMKLSREARARNGLQVLSGKDRSGKLADIPGGGTWERQHIKGDGAFCDAGKDDHRAGWTRGSTGGLVPCYMGD